jgi:hypothetical protein
MKTSHKYHWINKLKIPIHLEHNIHHITIQDLAKVLTEKQIKQFDEYFGVQTCLFRNDGQAGLYLHDVEAVLVRIFDKKLVGSQRYWD